MLVEISGDLLLIRRGNQPALGRWSFPSGYIDRGESIEDGAVREVREETGLDVTLTSLLGLHSKTDSPIVLAVYTAEVVGGRLEAGHDAIEVALFHPDNLPELPFDHDDQILNNWRERKTTA